MPAPTVLVVGRRASHLTWTTDVQAGFDAAGCITDRFEVNPARRSPMRRLEKALTGRKHLRSRAVVHALAARLGRLAPDLVVLLWTHVLEPWCAAALRRAAPPGCAIVGWIADCIDHLRPAGTAPLDRVYYFDSHAATALRALYGGDERLRWLPLAANDRRYAAAGAERGAARIPRLLFAGSRTPARDELVAALRAREVPVDALGPGWPGDGAARSPEALDALYGRYAAALNVNQAPNTIDGLNLRAFEVPAAGGVLLNPDVPDLARCFEPGREVLAWRGADDVAAHARRLLAAPEEGRAIGAAGRRRVLAEHTFRHRAETILRDVEEGRRA